MAIFRSSRSQMFFQIFFLKKFSKFTEKYMCRCLSFNAIAGTRSAALFKKVALAHIFSSELFQFFKSTSGQLPLSVLCFVLCSFFEYISGKFHEVFIQTTTEQLPRWHVNLAFVLLALNIFQTFL